MSLNIDEDNESTLKGPWYLHSKYWKGTASNYISAYNLIPADAAHHLELKTYVYQSIYRLIYESNLLEGEGLSRGETRRIAEEYFPHLPSSYDSIKQMMQVCRTPFDLVLKEDCQDTIDDVCLKYQNLIPTISFKNRSRAFKEVIQHYTAYLQSNIKSIQYKMKYLKSIATDAIALVYKAQYNKVPTSKEIETYLSDSEARTKMSEDLELNSTFVSRVTKNVDLSSQLGITPIILVLKKLNVTPKPVYLFSEAGIKLLHKILAEGLIDKTAGVPAGEYRIDNRTVGDLDLVFPAPELIPQCMCQFVSRANSLVDSLWEHPENLFEVAARVSHKFVRIHPFPDFNGRLSRLLLTVILNTFGVPFPVTLRGDKKGRHRYLSSLRKANKGHLKPYTTLIAMRVAESFMEIDQNLGLAGLPSILTFLKAK